MLVNIIMLDERSRQVGQECPWVQFYVVDGKECEIHDLFGGHSATESALRFFVVARGTKEHGCEYMDLYMKFNEALDEYGASLLFLLTAESW